MRSRKWRKNRGVGQATARSLAEHGWVLDDLLGGAVSEAQFFGEYFQQVGTSDHLELIHRSPCC